MYNIGQGFGMLKVQGTANSVAGYTYPQTDWMKNRRGGTRS